jgi:hypothetical protein
LLVRWNRIKNVSEAGSVVGDNREGNEIVEFIFEVIFESGRVVLRDVFLLENAEAGRDADSVTRTIPLLHTKQFLTENIVCVVGKAALI